MTILPFNNRDYPMYLVKTIPSHESDEWVQKLNTEPNDFVPLPMVPQRSFDGLAIVHKDAVYLFEIDRVEDGDGQVVACGQNEDQPVIGTLNVFPRLGTMRTRPSTVRGFQGIRYLTEEQLCD